MNILITGGAGFVGTNLILRLLKEKHIIHVLDNYSTGNKSNHVEGVRYFEKDICDISSFPNSNYDIIYHLAGLSRIQPSFDNPEETFRVNSIGTQKVCEYARNNNIKVIYAGSSSKHHNPYQSPYSACKYIGEEICKTYRKTYNMDIEIVRFYNVYGPYEILDGDWAAVIGIWRRQVRDNETITIVGDGEQRRDFTHVNDIVDGLYKVGIGNKKHKDAWELGSGVNYSINEVYQMFRAKFKIKCKYIPDQKGNYRETLRKNDDTLKKLDWKPKESLLHYIQNL